MLNDEQPTFVRPGMLSESVLDLYIVSPDVLILWNLEPDTLRSDHLPTPLVAAHKLPARVETHRAVYFPFSPFRITSRPLLREMTLATLLRLLISIS